MPGGECVLTGLFAGFPASAIRFDHWTPRELILLCCSLLFAVAVTSVAFVLRERRRRAYTRALERLGEISLAIASEPSSSGGDGLLLDRLSAAAREQLGLPMSRVLLLDDARQHLVVVHTHGVRLGLDDPGLVVGTRYRVCEEGKKMKCLERGEVVAVEDALRAPGPFSDKAVEVHGIRSGLYVPLISNQRPIGLLALADTKRRRFSEEERRLAGLLGAQAAMAIANARLYAQKDHAVRAAQQAQAQREALYATALDVQAAPSTEEAIQRLADRAPAALGVDLCAVCIDAADRSAPEQIRIVAISKLDRPTPPAIAPGSLKHCPNSIRVIRGGVTVAVEDAAVDPALRELNLPMIGSVLYVPMTGRAAVALGALALVRQSKGPFEEQTRQFAELFASRAAAAIENARLHEQTRRDAQAKAALLNELNHRVKNNLAAIVGLLSMGSSSIEGPAQQWLERVTERIAAMAQAHDLFSVGRQVRLGELIGAALDSAGVGKPENVRVTVEIDADADVVVPAEQAVPLVMVVYELAYNALVHGTGDSGELCVRARRTDGCCGPTITSAPHGLNIEVIDDGGAARELAAVGSARRSESGSDFVPLHHGMGLSLVQGFVSRELHGKFESKRDALTGGTIASVTIPLPLAPDTTNVETRLGVSRHD